MIDQKLFDKNIVILQNNINKLSKKIYDESQISKFDKKQINYLPSKN